jgi:hypothetical protein
MATAKLYTESLPIATMLESTRRVFGIPELLHMILERLETRDLLAARRVCRALSLSITASPRLATQLFHRDREYPKMLPLKWLSKLCQVAAVQQSRGKEQVVLHVVWSPRRRRQLRLVKHSPFLCAMLLAQPAPNLLRIFRICNCRGDASLIHELFVSGRKLTVAHLAHVMLLLPTTGSKGNPCICPSCGVDGKLRITGSKV